MGAESSLKIIKAYMDGDRYVIVRKMSCKKAHIHARRKSIPGKVWSRAVRKKGIWYCITRVKVRTIKND